MKDDFYCCCFYFSFFFFLFQECGKFSSHVASTLFKHILLREKKNILQIFKNSEHFSIIDKRLKTQLSALGKKNKTNQVT